MSCLDLLISLHLSARTLLTSIYTQAHTIWTPFQLSGCLFAAQQMRYTRFAVPWNWRKRARTRKRDGFCWYSAGRVCNCTPSGIYVQCALHWAPLTLRHGRYIVIICHLCRKKARKKRCTSIVERNASTQSNKNAAHFEMQHRLLQFQHLAFLSFAFHRRLLSLASAFWLQTHFISSSLNFISV